MIKRKTKTDTRNLGSPNFLHEENFYDPANPRRDSFDHMLYRPRRRLIKKIILWTIGIVLLAALAYGSFVVCEIYSVSKKINSNSQNNQDSFLNTVKATVATITHSQPINLKGMDSGRINILLLGIGGKGNPGPNLTDTMMIASVNTKTDQVALLSIPRDLYVEIPDTKLYTKINAVYQYGLDNEKDSGNTDEAMQPLIATIKDITSLDVDYYVILDFSGFTKVIDAVGGIDVMNNQNFYDPTYPGPNYTYETFSLKKGFQHLDGAVALQYARERHDDPQGDFGRAHRQQQILQATKDKIFSAGTLLNVVALNNLFTALGDDIRTNIQPQEIESFLELSKELDTQNVTTSVIDAWNKGSLLKVSHVPYGNINAFILIPRVGLGNYSEIRNLAKNIFDLDAITRNQTEIAQENANVALLNQTGDTQIISKIKNLLVDDLGYKNVTVLNDKEALPSDTTTAYDLTDGNKPFTLNDLVTKLPAKATYDIPFDIQSLTAGKDIDIVVGIGSDLLSRYNMQEDSVQDFNKAQDSQEYLNLLEQPGSSN